MAVWLCGGHKAGVHSRGPDGSRPGVDKRSYKGVNLLFLVEFIWDWLGSTFDFLYLLRELYFSICLHGF